MTPSVTASGAPRVAPLAIKVCGLRTAEHLRWVGQSGATLAGFVFAASRRRVTVAEAQAALAPPAGSRMGHPPEIVGVFADQDESEVAAIAAACPLQIVQLSGRESPRVTAALVARGLRVIKTLHVEESMTAVEALRAITPHVEAGAEVILLDSASRQGGGSGKVFDWAVALEVSSRGLAPVLLAGGLTPTNVAAAVATVRPWGVDVSSGVETDGIKDRAKIEAFVGAARAASTPAAARQPREF